MRLILYRLATDEYRGLCAKLIKGLLFIFSLIYGLIVRFLILSCRPKPLPFKCKVISIGNITWGGTGKTVLAEFIAGYLKQKQHKLAILSRGYKKSAGIGDEPFMLQKKLEVPVIVDSNRARGAKKAVSEYAVDTVILDDGFQQWQIKKDLEIIAIDATDPFGNCNMLPRGVLREPLSSLKRADIFAITKTNLNPDIGDIKTALSGINPRAEIFETMHMPVGFYKIGAPRQLLSESIFKNKTAALFCGIGDPDSFENLTRALGINTGLFFKFSDHHRYSTQDFNKMAAKAGEKGIDILITTEKDAARLQDLAVCIPQLPIFILRIKLKAKDEERFFNRLGRVYNG